MVDEMRERATRERWSYAEFARLPSDGNRYEVIAGELFVSAAPRPLHQDIVSELAIRLRTHASRHDLGSVLVGPINVLLAEGDYLEPDLVFVRKERIGILSDRGVEGPPDLVVEVTSPTTAERDRSVKRRRYRHYGVPQYWIVDRDARHVEVDRLGQRSEAHAESVTWIPYPDAPTLVVMFLRSFVGSSEADMTIEELKNEALKLPHHERARLARELIESLDEDAEIEPRATPMSLVQSEGTVAAVPGEELPPLTDDVVRATLERTRRFRRCPSAP